MYIEFLSCKPAVNFFENRLLNRAFLGHFFSILAYGWVRTLSEPAPEPPLKENQMGKKGKGRRKGNKKQKGKGKEDKEGKFKEREAMTGLRK